MHTKHLQLLQSVLSGYTKILIIPHNDPDPDAIASAYGLSYLLSTYFSVDAGIAYRGIIGRAENKALIHYLRNPLHHLQAQELEEKVGIALVDTQPWAGNNPFAANKTPAIVIDHHTLLETSAKALFADIRPDFGATATIITEYLQEANLEPPIPLATALFYGIKTDTLGLGRGAVSNDVDAYLYLQSRIDIDALLKIERAQVPATYYKSLYNALQCTRIYEDIAIVYIGRMNYPDLGAEIADLLLRRQGIQWVICMGTYGGELIVAVRSRNKRFGAGRLVREIVGQHGTAGGHGTMAAGHIRINKTNPNEIAEHLSKNTLKFLKGDEALEGKPLY